MRRSKSNPAKYVKNYRSLSQRRMTEVQQPLPSSSVLAEAPSSALAPSFVSSNNKDNGEDRHPPPSPVIPIILSNELQQEYGPDEVAILEGSNKTHKASKHSTTNTKHTTISVQELTHATRQSKQDRKKSLQLAQRAAAKQKRAALYAALQACAVPAAHRPLLHSSAQWSSIGINSSNNNSSSGKQSKSNQSTDAEAMVLPTKRLRRNHALLRQRAGLDCVDATTTGTHSSSNSNPIQDDNRTHAKPDNDNTDTDDDDNLDTDDHMEDAQRPPAPNTNTPTTNTKLPHPLQTNRDTATPKSDVDEGEPKRSLKRPRSTTGNTTNNSSPTPCADFERTTGDDVMDTAAQNNNHASSAIPLAATDAALSSTNDSLLSVPPPASTTVLPCTSAATEAGAGRFLATQMMASLVTLQKKTKSTTEPTQQHPLSTSNDTPGPNDGSLAVRKSSKQESVKYVPSDPISLQTTQSYSKVATAQTNAGGVVVPGRNLVRPPSVTAVRYDLPVATMEFDIMEAIRNHDVTILCAATGSGKSTQIPQFLYEAGLSRSMTETAPETSMPNSRCIIGVTQPRRVAAVSTAKRVCYEMGLGSGSSISSNNVVAYQTRHETAGYGRNTQIKFMTDGILLQEIQKDLLLRQYSVIVLDEAHERNLNTDVLLGLLSAALPLRQLAAAEANSTIRPLKVVIMSATLRVQDFTNQPRLFSSPTTTTVVTVPGRTYPVTIHHNKVTELDSYEDAAFQKTCKIHRQLPEGSILLFMTGKQEIIRMVNRLRRALRPKDERESKDRESSAEHLIDHSVTLDETLYLTNDIPRDMDDDEIDGDLFQSAASSNDFDDAEHNDASSLHSQTETENGSLKAIVLPLYSLLSTEEQAQIFAPVSEGCRLIVVATNIAETSITIPGVSYVVDTGRQKCRNFHAETGVASFDIMWISKAAADQRAGRAGRTGPGHCYRLYSSSLYSRHMDAFALPEVLTRPLEDVVLAMKVMKVSNVCDFPFPTPPDRSQVDAAAKLLANLGCLDLSKVEQVGGDGEITRLGRAIAKLPLGVRFSKMLLVAAEAGVLDYAIPIVAALSEPNPFIVSGQSKLEENAQETEEVELSAENGTAAKITKPPKWYHKGGDVLGTMIAVGAYTFAGRNAGGSSEKLACKSFCEKNGLHFVVMERIQKMRCHLARLSKLRLGNVEGVAAKTGGFVSSMPPPNKLQERLLCQSIASGLLDRIAFLAPLGSIPGQHPFSLRSAYLSCSSILKEPLFMDRNSVVYSRDARLLPQWICFETIMRKTRADGTSVAIMKNITPIDVSWLGRLAEGSQLLSIEEPLSTPLPVYDSSRDAVLCSVKTRYGTNGWEIPPVQMVMFDAIHSSNNTNNATQQRSCCFMADDSFRWFGRYLLEGKVFVELQAVRDMLNDCPSTMTRHKSSTAASPKVALLVSALSSAGIDSAAALRKHWASVDNKFLFNIVGKKWVKAGREAEFQKIWIATVKQNIGIWNRMAKKETSAI